MSGILILLIFLIGCLQFSYVASDRDIMAPSVLFVGGFVIATIAASMNIQAWGIDFSYKTILIIVIGNISFAFAEIIFRIILKNHKKNEISNLKIILVPEWKTILVIIFDLFTIVLYYHEIVRLSVYAESYWQSFGIMVAYKRAITYGGYTVNSVVNQMTKMVYVFGYIYSYILINNYFSKKRKFNLKTKLFNLLPIILYVALSILKGNRIDIFALIIMMIFLYYYTLHRKIGWEKHISGKLLVRIIVLFILSMLVFYYMKGMVGRVSSLKFLDYITQYIGGSIELLDLYVKDKYITISQHSILFEETLPGLINGLKKLGFFDIVLRKQLEFRYTPTNIYLGNVYTALRRYYSDCGWLGIIIFPAILSFIMNSLYRHIQMNNRYSIKSIFSIIVYGSIIYVIPFQAIEDIFWISKVTIGYLVELFILYFCLKFLLTNYKVNLGEHYVKKK